MSQNTFLCLSCDSIQPQRKSAKVSPNTPLREEGKKRKTRTAQCGVREARTDISRKGGNAGGAERSFPKSGCHTVTWNVIVRGSEGRGHGVLENMESRPSSLCFHCSDTKTKKSDQLKHTVFKSVNKRFICRFSPNTANKEMISRSSTLQMSCKSKEIPFSEIRDKENQKILITDDRWLLAWLQKWIKPLINY